MRKLERMELKTTSRPSGPAKPGRRQDILNVASDLFGQHGVSSVTTRQIAARVGISQPSLYAHFTSVQHIHAELCAQAFALLERHIEGVLAGDAAGDGLLKEAIAAYFDFGFTHSVAYKIAFMIEYPADGEMSQASYEGEDHPGPRAFAGMKQVLARVRPDLDEARLDTLGKSLWAHLHGLVSLMLARPSFPWGGKDRLIAQHARSALGLVKAYDPSWPAS